MAVVRGVDQLAARRSGRKGVRQVHQRVQRRGTGPLAVAAVLARHDQVARVEVGRPGHLARAVAEVAAVGGGTPELVAGVNVVGGVAVAGPGAGGGEAEQQVGVGGVGRFAAVVQDVPDLPGGRVAASGRPGRWFNQEPDRQGSGVVGPVHLRDLAVRVDGQDQLARRVLPQALERLHGLCREDDVEGRPADVVLPDGGAVGQDGVGLEHVAVQDPRDAAGFLHLHGQGNHGTVDGKREAQLERPEHGKAHVADLVGGRDRVPRRRVPPAGPGRREPEAVRREPMEHVHQVCPVGLFHGECLAVQTAIGLAAADGGCQPVRAHAQALGHQGRARELLRVRHGRVGFHGGRVKDLPHAGPHRPVRPHHVLPRDAVARIPAAVAAGLGNEVEVHGGRLREGLGLHGGRQVHQAAAVHAVLGDAGFGEDRRAGRDRRNLIVPAAAHPPGDGNQPDNRRQGRQPSTARLVRLHGFLLFFPSFRCGPAGSP